MNPDLRSTIGGVVSGVGSVLVAASYFYAPLLPIGAAISAFGKWYLGLVVPDKENVTKKVTP